MKKIILFIIIFLIQTIAYTSSKIDSLKLVLQKTELTQKAIVLNQLAEQYRKKSEKESEYRPITLQYAQKAFVLAQTYNDKQQQALALYSIATIYKMDKNMEQALLYYNSSQLICNEINDQETVSKCYSNIGLIYYLYKSYALAIDYYKRSVHSKELIFKADDTNTEKALTLGKSFLQLGNVYKDINKLDVSYSYYSKAMHYFELAADTTAIATCYNNQGAILYIMNKNKEALTYYQKALHLHQKAGNYYETVDQYFNIGIFYFETAHYKNALDYIQQGIAICKEIENFGKLAHGYTLLANIYGNLNNFAEAKKQYKLAIETCKANEDEASLASVYFSLGSLYLNNKKPNDAITYFNLSYDISKQSNSIMDLMNVTENLYLYYEKTGNASKALAFYKLHRAYKDSIGNSDIAGKIAELELKSKIEQQETSLKMKTEIRIAAEHRINNIQNFSIFIFIIIFLSSIFFFGHITLPKVVAEGIVFFTIVITLGFITILLDPYINQWSHGKPIFSLLANIILTLAIFPAHNWFENSLKRKVLKVHHQGQNEHDYTFDKKLNIKSKHTIN